MTQTKSSEVVMILTAVMGGLSYFMDKPITVPVVIGGIIATIGIYLHEVG